MVKVRYTGLIDPARELEALRPAYQATTRLMAKCKPFSPDYLALLEITKALNGAAAHFIGQQSVGSFFGSRPTG